MAFVPSNDAHGRTVARQLPVGGKQDQGFGQALGYQHAVDGVFVIREDRQGREGENMIGFDASQQKPSASDFRTKRGKSRWSLPAFTLIAITHKLARLRKTVSAS